MKKTMKAAIFKGNGKIEVEKTAKPILKDTTFKKWNGGELVFGKQDLVILKILRSGICGTELRILSVPQQFPALPGTITGHEFTGEIVEIGKRVKRVKIGNRVVVDEHIWCGDCWPCRNGYFNRCEEMASLGMTHHGGFAQYAIIPAKQIYKVPADFNLDKAVLFEPLYCATYALNKVNLRSNETVLIFGGGPLGCCFVELCRINGIKKIIVSEPEDYRMPFAENLGAKVINPKKENLKKIIEELTNDRGADVTIDASGNPKIIPEALELTRIHGRIILFGQVDDLAKITISPTIANRKELKIYGSDAANPVTADQTIEILQRDDFKLDSIITHRIPLEKISEGVKLMRKRQSMKIVVYPWR